jgi:hypothetical protein
METAFLREGLYRVTSHQSEDEGVVAFNESESWIAAAEAEVGALEAAKRRDSRKFHHASGRFEPGELTGIGIPRVKELTARVEALGQRLRAMMAR